MNQVEALEQAILKRAQEMAQESLQRGESGRRNILREANERLHLREEKETLLAKSLADRSYLHQVQADELKLRSKLDHMRWNLVQTVMQRLPELFAAFRADTPQYHQYLQALLRQAAEQIGMGKLEVALNSDDHKQLHRQWETFTQGLHPQTKFSLAEHPIETLGGLLVTTPDGRVRIDHTFEGRLQRLQGKIQQAMVERLLPPASEGFSLL